MLGGLLSGFFFFFKQKTAYEMRISDWSSDVCSSDLRAFFARADAVAPVILVGEAAAGPADDGDVQLFERGHHVAAIAVGVGDFRIGADPDAVVGAAAEILGELALDRGLDRCAGRLEVVRTRTLRGLLRPPPHPHPTHGSPTRRPG